MQQIEYFFVDTKKPTRFKSIDSFFKEEISLNPGVAFINV